MIEVKIDMWIQTKRYTPHRGEMIELTKSRLHQQVAVVRKAVKEEKNITSALNFFIQKQLHVFHYCGKAESYVQDVEQQSHGV